MKFGYSVFFIACIIIFSLSCYYYYPFLSDDSLISLRYAQRFIEGKGLNWTDGKPVEGYSNLLWILGISALGKMGVGLILSARILGFVCSIGTIGVILNYFRKQNIRKEYVFFAVLLLVTTPCFTVWAIGGLEQPLYILLLTLVIVEVLHTINTKNLKRVYHLSLWLGLLALTRPDGFLFTILAAGFLLFINRNNTSSLLKLVLSVVCIPSLFVLAQLAFRYSYYGELVPNTALVKVKISLHHILRGGFYSVKAFLGTALFSGLGVYFLYILSIKKQNLSGLYLLLNVAVWTLYITLVGGDIFPAFRHYYVILIFFVFAIILGLHTVQPSHVYSKKILSICIVIFVASIWLQTIFPDNRNVKEEKWEFRGMHLGEKLKNIFPSNTLIAVTASGCIPYSSELPAIDMLGLNDYYTPRHPPANFGTGALAHELGDARYILKRNPDIIIFNTGGILNFNIGEQLKVNKNFNDNFIKILATEGDSKYILFFNKYGKNAGIKESSNELKIPGYLLQNKKDTVSVFTDRKLLKRMQKGNIYTISIDHIPPKNWMVKFGQEQSTDFSTEIEYKNKQLKVSVIPKKELLLESLVLQGKD